MNTLKKTILPILLATIWISISEFARNEFMVKSHWVNHYQSLGLKFPSETINGVIWGIWSLMLATAIFFISKKFSLIQTTFIVWFIAFAMMWVVIGNLNVLPYSLLWYAIPLSFIESFVATWIIKRFTK